MHFNLRQIHVIETYCGINFYSWGPMFTDYLNLVGSLDCNYVDNWFVVLLCKTIHYFVTHMWKHEFW